MRYLSHGRVVDVSRLQARLGWGPRPTLEAFDDFAATRSPGPLLAAEVASVLEERVLDLAGRLFPGPRTAASGAPRA